MRYWVLKGNPHANNWDAILRPGHLGTWRSGRVPTAFSRGDRVFCWESTPALRIVGLAVVEHADIGQDEEGDTLFRVRYQTRRLSNMPTIHALRQVPILGQASFLKAGPATTLFPLTLEQAEILFQLLAKGNDELEKIWRDLDAGLSLITSDLDLMFAAKEGGMRLTTHLIRERNRRIVNAKRQQVLLATGRLACEVCKFDFHTCYGDVGAGFCEVHHRIPLAKTTRAIETSLDDLAVICSNCHRMIHRCKEFPSIEEFSKRIMRKA